MKAVNTIVKILTALAAVAGVVYVIATYGDKIVAWAKKLLAACPKCEVEVVADTDLVDDAELTEEEAVAEEAPVEEVAAEEAPVDEAAPVAEETDFEG